jgi:hypothetical protein
MPNHCDCTNLCRFCSALATRAPGMRRAVGAVVVFEPGVTIDQVRKAFAGVAGVHSVDAQTFDPQTGMPVFYIP